jgi:hypothetical protein
MVDEERILVFLPGWSELVGLFGGLEMFYFLFCVMVSASVKWESDSNCKTLHSTTDDHPQQR